MLFNSEVVVKLFYRQEEFFIESTVFWEELICLLLIYKLLYISDLCWEIKDIFIRKNN